MITLRIWAIVVLAVVVLAAALGAAPAAFAQGAEPKAEARPDPKAAAAPSNADLAQKASARLNRLFDRLREADDPTVARGIATEIERAFERSGSATADLLYSRAKEAMEAKDLDLALDLLDYVVTLTPGWAEPYHRRAIIHFINRDQDAAFRDVREALAREPRHFHALAGLGGIMQAFGDQKGAFKAFSRALEIYPQFTDLKESVEKMRPEIEGQPL